MFCVADLPPRVAWREFRKVSAPVGQSGPSHVYSRCFPLHHPSEPTQRRSKRGPGKLLLLKRRAFKPHILGAAARCR
jgi:hypothetical protein